MKMFKVIITGIVSLFVALSILYGCYWVVKTVSYSFFYEDMVIRTINKTVKPEALK